MGQPESLSGIAIELYNALAKKNKANLSTLLRRKVGTTDYIENRRIAEIQVSLESLLTERDLEQVKKNKKRLGIVE
ncbi:MAG: hypothetical protein ABIH82_00240 [Candidatus Woesearchaeota archaeon]